MNFTHASMPWISTWQWQQTVLAVLTTGISSCWDQIWSPRRRNNLGECGRGRGNFGNETSSLSDRQLYFPLPNWCSVNEIKPRFSCLQFDLVICCNSWRCNWMNTCKHTWPIYHRIRLLQLTPSSNIHWLWTDVCCSSVEHPWACSVLTLHAALVGALKSHWEVELTAVDQTAVVSDFFHQNYSYIYIESGHGAVVLSHLPTVYSMQYGTFLYRCLSPIPRLPHFNPYITWNSILGA